MMIRDNEKTILSLEHAGYKHTSELPWDASLDDIFDSLYGLCTAATFRPESVLDGMKEWLENKYGKELYFYEDGEDEAQ